MQITCGYCKGGHGVCMVGNSTETRFYRIFDSSNGTEKETTKRYFCDPICHMKASIVDSSKSFVPTSWDSMYNGFYLPRDEFYSGAKLSALHREYDEIVSSRHNGDGDGDVSNDGSQYSDELSD